MDLGFSAEQDELRQSVQRFIEQQFPRDSVRSRLEAPNRWTRRSGSGPRSSAGRACWCPRSTVAVR